MTLFGLTRVRNESRWVVECVNRMLPVCERVFVLSDGSTDGTPELCEALGERVTVIRSPFREPVDQGLDESRDREMLLQRAMDCVSDKHLMGDTYSPFFALSLDADEWLDPASYDVIRSTLKTTVHHAFKVKLPFLWDSDLSLINTPGHRRIRVDGVYRRFAEEGRPSIFRLMNRAFRYQRTPWGGNFHCSSIPQELLAAVHQPINVTAWHTGYCYKEDRLRKHAFYNRVDPGNQAEDCYKHVVQGDVPEIPAGIKLKWAGPMQFEMM